MASRTASDTNRQNAAHVYAGLVAGTTRARFEDVLRRGDDLTELLHRLDVTPGTALYLPSGRVHAIGPGCLIAEVQQSSDTTYRVFDYGRPRELHVEESLTCIDFDDHEPSLLEDTTTPITTPYFEMTRLELNGAGPVPAGAPGEAAIVGVLHGDVTCGARSFSAGEFFLCPAAGALDLSAPDAAEALVVELPDA